MKKNWLYLCIAAVIFACKSPSPVANKAMLPVREVPPGGSGWNLSFEENFDADLSQWKVWYGGAYNNELQCYVPDALTVKNGVLSIKVENKKVLGPVLPTDSTIKTFDYTSGRIESKQHFSAGANTPQVLMQARIQAPKGYGMWPAFWSYGDPWPTQGEIDALEARGQTPTQYQNNYFFGTEPGKNLVRDAVAFFETGTDLTASYHTYSLLWTRDSLVSYFDGKLMEVKRSGGYINALFGTRQRVILNLAVGGGFFENFDATKISTGAMYVDWVRVYRR